MYKLSARLERLAAYEPVAGDFSVRLDANESYFPTPDWLQSEIGNAVKTLDLSRYPDPACTKLREAFSGFYGLDAQSVTAGNGSDELISLIVNTFLEPGEVMAITRPDFSMYAVYGEIAGAPMAVYEKVSDTMSLDVEDLISFVKAQNARLFLFSNPCNPTSQKNSREEILRIVERLDNCLVVVDEAYMDFSQGSILRMAHEYNNLIVLKTCSKTGMAGIRLGFAVANPTLTQVLQAVRSPYNINSMTQAAGCVWFSHGDYIRSCVKHIQASRDTLCQKLTELSKDNSAIQVYPSQANFVFVRMADAVGVWKALAEKGISVRLMGDFLRITAGSDEENKCLLQAFAKIL